MSPESTDPDLNRYTLFPWRLVEELTAVLQHKGARFVTFGELELAPSDCRAGVGYAREYAAFKTGFELGVLSMAFRAIVSAARRRPSLLPLARWTGLRRPTVPHVLLHHDADRQPAKTVEMMHLERRLGVVSSNYFFVRRCPRWDGDEEPYAPDYPELQRLESAGFEVGYHLNAMERANYDPVVALRVADEDVEFLRRRIRLRTFVPHGGRPGPNGQNNESIPYYGQIGELVWAYNGRGVFNEVAWSDGHAEGERAVRLKDPRVLASHLKGRVRAHFLLHPQYYGDQLRPDWESLPIAQLGWWRQLWNLD
jgi:hypothetical protein